MGAVRSINAVLKNLNNSTQASIVLFSTVAVQIGMPFHSSVAVSKGAIEGLTRSLAAELAPKISVNAIAPSIVNTPLAEKFLNSESKMERAVERHPLKKVGSADEIANFAIQLLFKLATYSQNRPSDSFPDRTTPAYSSDHSSTTPMLKANCFNLVP